MNKEFKEKQYKYKPLISYDRRLLLFETLIAVLFTAAMAFVLVQLI